MKELCFRRDLGHEVVVHGADPLHQRSPEQHPVTVQDPLQMCKASATAAFSSEDVYRGTSLIRNTHPQMITTGP
jgi:hypothetical protein